MVQVGLGMVLNVVAEEVICNVRDLDKDTGSMGET